MSKKIVLAGGCFWGEDSVGHCLQDLASYFEKIATRYTASVRSRRPFVNRIYV